MRPLMISLVASAALTAAVAAPMNPEQFTPAALRERIERQAPRGGVASIRERMREIKRIHNLLLERSIGSRYAFGGHYELLLYDSNDLLEPTLSAIQRYRVLVQEMRDLPAGEFLRDPGTQWALERAVSFGERTALAIPRVHRLGYLRIQPILDGPLNLEYPHIFGERLPEGAVVTSW